MTIDPWGTILARSPEEEGYVITDIDLNQLEDTRNKVPCFSRRRLELYTNK